MKKKITFITGNHKKAEYVSKYLGFPVGHRKTELDEIQSLDLRRIVEHKVRQAYKIIKGPVLVEDASLEFEALGGLPGPFIKFFIEHVPLETICSMLDGKSRKAVAKGVYGYYDGKILKMFEGKLEGRIPNKPSGNGGFGYDSFFIPKGYRITRASLSEKDDQKTYMRIKPLAKVKKFLKNNL
jgi:non-canonical purine NTP pyrophosphatase (RdgB/HAM1 family)